MTKLLAFARGKGHFAAAADEAGVQRANGEVRRFVIPGHFGGRLGRERGQGRGGMNHLWYFICFYPYISVKILIRIS